MNAQSTDEFWQSLKEIAGHVVVNLPKAIVVVLIAVALYYIVKRVIKFLAVRTSTTFADPATRAAKYFFILSAIFLVCGVYGADLGGIWAMLGTVGALVAVGFVAVWSVLSNLSCTIMILFFRPFEVGDELEFTDPAGLRGKVINLNFAYTTLRDDDGRLIQIPNNLFFQRITKRRPVERKTDVSLAEQLRAPEDKKI